MSRKDYRVIAEAINRARNDMTTFEYPVADILTSYITSALAQHNANFDRSTFLQAANYHDVRNHNHIV